MSFYAANLVYAGAENKQIRLSDYFQDGLSIWLKLYITQYYNRTGAWLLNNNLIVTYTPTSPGGNIGVESWQITMNRLCCLELFLPPVGLRQNDLSLSWGIAEAVNVVIVGRTLPATIAKPRFKLDFALHANPVLVDQLLFRARGFAPGRANWFLDCQAGGAAGQIVKIRELDELSNTYATTALITGGANAFAQLLNQQVYNFTDCLFSTNASTSLHITSEMVD